MTEDTDTPEELPTLPEVKRPAPRRKPAPPTIDTGEAATAARLAAVQREVEAAKEAARTQWEEDCNFAKTTGCPPPPKKNPQFGDKSKAFVQWLHDHRHDEFCKRFGVIRKGRVPIFEKNRETGIEEQVRTRETYFATRKTHLTEVENNDRTLGDDMDWNA